MVAKRLLAFLAVMVCIVGVGRVALAQTSTSGTESSDGTTLFNVAEPHTNTIPKEALRLRIIANSDSDGDQTLKREVRDAVVVQVGQLVAGAQSADEAKARVMKALPEIRNTALAVTHEHGYHYAVNTDVGQVPFPTKVYGNQVYPAGNYEALRITLGAGQGQNWWCVLFPPLCFVDIADGDAVPNTGGFPDLPPLETISVPDANGKPTQVQVRMASVDYGEELWKSVKNLFH